VFAIQEQIAAEVVKQLKVELLGEAPTLTTTDPTAYTVFLQGRHQARLGTTEGFAQAGFLLRQALGIDPSYARAWSELARIYGNQAGVGLISSAEGYRLSREAAEKALALDPRLASAHGRLAWIAMFHDRDLAQAARHLERGLEIDPVNNDLLRNAAALVKYLGRLDEAIQIGSYAVARDPVNPTGHSNLGFAYFYAGRSEEALASFHKTLELSPNRIAVRYYIGALELSAGNSQKALEISQMEPFELFRLVGLVMIYHALGDEPESDAALAQLMEDHAQEAAYNIAYALAFRGEADRAFVWLEKAAEVRDPGLGDVMHEPRFRNLHDDPRWLPFLRSIGKAPEQLDAIEFRITLPH
jgi:tetratricopeptide (TPR) repeat protein